MQAKNSAKPPGHDQEAVVDVVVPARVLPLNLDLERLLRCAGGPPDAQRLPLLRRAPRARRSLTAASEGDRPASAAAPP